MAKETASSTTDKPTGFTKAQYDKCLNVLFVFMIGLTIVGTYFTCININQFTSSLQAQNKAYDFPGIKDLKPVLYIFPLIILIKKILEWTFVQFTPYIIANKYKDPTNVAVYQLGQMYITKLAMHITKLIYYIFISVLSFIVLMQVDYFPKSLGGSGALPNMFIAGYPNSFYHFKPKYFDLCYLICLSFIFSDLFFLLFVYKRQNDFINMILHHFCTISLILFSFLVNYSHIGAIVLFLHNVSDIFVHSTRLLLQTDAYEIIKTSSGVVLTVTMIYTRLFVFADVIYTAWNYITWKWEWVTWTLWTFLGFLYIMHLNWSFVLLQKAWLKFICSKNIDDNIAFVPPETEAKPKAKAKAN